MNSNKFSKLEEFSEMVLPMRKFYEIGTFIENAESHDPPLLKKKIEEAKKENPYLEGVKNIEHAVTLDNRDVLIITLEENHFPPNPLTGPGIAFPKKGIAFVCDGFSESAQKMIRDHEFYHLQKNAHIIHQIPVVNLFHETETVLKANVSQDIIGTARAGIETIKKSPKLIRRYIQHIREQLKKIFRSK